MRRSRSQEGPCWVCIIGGTAVLIVLLAALGAAVYGAMLYLVAPA